ncbi:hypothetical protein [Pinibacter aurantiacus]|uniref:Glycine zipper family protein n=1 Tax=Pinibacter aurantiacus TaxID=2851599 RepID=A0A9E2W6Z2_9BACT|nr:hypothetical protein [Pinibacter aurantiacus]MBV4360589.1 hypothetical protein [Pinibacter aurantiacus]
MKTPILFFLIFISCAAHAQKQLFVRVYDLSGKKIGKGHIIAITDSIIHLQTVTKRDSIEPRYIGSIRTRRAPGHNIGIGMLAGGISGAIFGAIDGQPDDTQEGQVQMNFISPAGEAVLGLAAGLAVGALVGTITYTIKGSKYIAIKGSSVKWKEFQLMVADYNARHQ